MSPVVIGFLLLLLPYQGRAKSVTFQQSPPKIVTKNTEVDFKCSHNDSSLTVMLWYQQTESGLMNFIGYGYTSGDPTYEKEFEDRFKITRTGVQTGGLIIQSVNLPDSAVYYCAASMGTDAEAYFGKGTKLTVLEVGKEIAGPTVKVLQPSQKECRNEKDKIRKKTLVCVASKFYPDHVSVYWQIKGENITDGVATDEDAQWMPGEKKRFYQITSRLRVPAEKWENSDNEFKCIVNFYNGSNTVPYSDSISGKALTTAKPMTREIYLKITQTAKLTYGVFIAKSCIYGAFVLFLVWKLQGSKGKQNY